ncbi:hypothetical protein EV1_015799 [Malus domestica]
MFRPTRVFPTPPPSICCLAVLLMVIHGLPFIDNQLISFSFWLSLLYGCAREVDRCWMIRSERRYLVVGVDFCRLRCTVLVEAVAADFSSFCLFLLFLGLFG